MLKTKISDDERYVLQQYNRTTKLELIRLKCFSVLIADQGLTGTAVSEIVGKSIRTVNRWLRDWEKQRLSSIFSGHQDNANAAKLTRDQLAQIKEVLASPPSDTGIPKDMWDVPTLKDYVLATFGVVYESPESYYFILRFSGLSFKYPDVFDLRRNEDLILERMQSIRAEIRPLLHRDDWEVFAVDEVKMQQEAIIRRCWLKRGERTVIKVDRKQQNQSYIGFLNQKSFTCHLYEMADKQNSKTVLVAMEQFLAEHPDKHIAIVWDNAAFHRSKDIREQLQRGGVMERVHLIPMPPYAPDENPIEHVWNTAKQKVANLQKNSFQETKDAFSDFVASRKFRYSF
jgi:transposase